MLFRSVVGFSGSDGQDVIVLPLSDWHGVAAGRRVTRISRDDAIFPDASWLGRVVDPFGAPLDGGPALGAGPRARPVRAAAPGAMTRRRVGPKMETGIRAMDIFTPLCRGQRMGVFAGSGVGKSTLMAMLARQAAADVIVVGLVGERGREVREFVENDLGEEGMARAVVVAATSDAAPLERRQAAWTATALAEHYRDTGAHVLLMLDSVTRFAMAQREIGLAAGEPPTAKGYPPSVFAEMPRLLERAGPGPEGAGDISALYTVLVDGGDHDEPVADALRGITDGHIVLDRAIAERGRFPAIDLLASVSRMLPSCHAEIERRILAAARGALARYADMEEMIRVGAYQEGTDPETDRAQRLAKPIEAFLTQAKGSATPSAEAFAELYGHLAEAGIAVEIPDMQEPGAP